MSAGAPRGGAPSRRTALGLLGLAALTALALAGLGRVLWCQVGDLSPWSWDVWTPHNSQHLVDPYSLSHVEHGLVFFLLLSALPFAWLVASVRLWIVALVEASWEVLENTPAVIERYREATISLDYYGDSIANSVADYGMCMGGLALALRLPWQATLAAVVALESVCLLWIRDSLLLNVLMLVYPIEAIRSWQAAVAG